MPPPRRTRKGGRRKARIDGLRFGAAIFPGRNRKKAGWADNLNVDRVPSAESEVRALVSLEECVRLVEEGFEVRLYSVLDETSFPKGLLVKDADFNKWIREAKSALDANTEPEPFLKVEE